MVIKHLLSYGFGSVYTYILFISPEPTSFVIAFPIAALMIIYMDPTFLLRTGFIMFLVNVADVIYSIKYLNMGSEGDMVNYEFQLLSTIVLVIFTYIATQTMQKINQKAMNNIYKEKEKSEELLQEIIEHTTVLTNNIDMLNEQSNRLSQQSNAVKTTIEDIYLGTKDNANTVHSQLLMTQNVNHEVNDSFEMFNKISTGFKATNQEATEGMTTIKELNMSADQTNKAGETVNKSVDILSNKMTDVYQIIDLINNIADQTRLLSLNASIEAARAGEAGKGFAVVAGEIQKLATNTTEATAEIQNLLDELQNETDTANKAVNELNDASSKQYKLIESTSEKLEHIIENISSFSTDINQQNHLMNNILENNGELTNSIEQFSAFSEELLASTENSKEVIDQTIEGISILNEKLIETMTSVNELKNKTSL